MVLSPRGHLGVGPGGGLKARRLVVRDFHEVEQQVHELNVAAIRRRWARGERWRRRWERLRTPRARVACRVACGGVEAAFVLFDGLRATNVLKCPRSPSPAPHWVAFAPAMRRSHFQDKR